jgi:hypothetical protein
MARKAKLRDLSRVQIASDELTALIDAFGEGEHPVATAILGAALIEHDLERLLRSKLKHKDDETWAMLTDYRGPLNSFHSMILIGYALGIYDKNIRNDLTVVRNIRNAFAHSKKLIKFDHPAVVEGLQKATRSVDPKKYWKLDAQQRYGILCLRLATKLAKIEAQPTKSRLQRLERKIRTAELLWLAGLSGTER